MVPWVLTSMEEAINEGLYLLKSAEHGTLQGSYKATKIIWTKFIGCIKKLAALDKGTNQFHNTILN